MSALIGDKGYDGDGFRAEIVDRGAKPIIPNKSNRITLHSFSKRAYKLPLADARNAPVRMRLACSADSAFKKYTPRA